VNAEGNFLSRVLRGIFPCNPLQELLFVVPLTDVDRLDPFSLSFARPGFLPKGRGSSEARAADS
jgi:hypothetical protein